MISAALVSFVTGITEPIEFAFIFRGSRAVRGPALLTGLSMALVAAWAGGWASVFGGAIDCPSTHQGSTQFFALIMAIGVVYFVMYCVVFTFVGQTPHSGPRIANRLRPGPRP